MATGSRPIGVTIVAVIAWLTGVWNLIQGILALIAGAPTWNVVSAWIIIIVGALTIVVSLGLFRGDPAARLVVTIVFAVDVLVALATAASGGISWMVAIPTVVLAVIGIVLLYAEGANSFFRRA